MKKTDKGQFIPKNPEKYIGDAKSIIYRSSWELSTMLSLDAHPYVLGWGSEVLSIPYKNPLTQKWTVYIPDFLVVMQDKSGNKVCEVIEIKPLKEVPGSVIISERTGKPQAISRQTRMTHIVNTAKWAAAQLYCKKKHWTFRIVTEQTLFGYKR